MVQVVISAELMAKGTENAVKTAKEVVARFHGQGDSQDKAMALQTVAKAHLAKGEYFKAAREAKNSQRILRKLGDTEGEVAMLGMAIKAHLNRPEAEGHQDALQT